MVRQNSSVLVSSFIRYFFLDRYGEVFLFSYVTIANLTLRIGLSLPDRPDAEVIFIRIVDWKTVACHSLLDFSNIMKLGAALKILISFSLAYILRKDTQNAIYCFTR